MSPRVTVAMINYLREDRLIKTLKSLLLHTKCSLNLVLQLQNLNKSKKREIEDICKGFNRYEIIQTKKNNGTAVPRYNTTMKAYEFNTEYILILDSDMEVKSDIVGRLIKEHESKDYGVISCWCDPSYSRWQIKNKTLISYQIKKEGFYDTDVLGTGCALVKRDVFKDSFFNRNIVIGFVDFHWCMEVKSHGWKLGILADKKYKLVNDSKYNTKQYKKERWQWKEIERSRQIFKIKYNIDITGSNGITNTEMNNKHINIDFFGSSSNNNIVGPSIQTLYKKQYFKSFKNFNINFNSIDDTSDWKHFIFAIKADQYPNIKNFSIGPNIDVDLPLSDRYHDKMVVADSIWMKNTLIDRFNLIDNNIHVIPVYVHKDFYNCDYKRNKKFVIGSVGYYEKSDIKGIQSLIKIATKMPNIQFEFLTSRKPSQLPFDLLNVKNIKIQRVQRDNIIKVMSKWSGYIGLSKRERGPAVLQEVKTIGIPSICPNHTGYKEFNPSVALDIQPFVTHSDSDIDLYIDAITDLKSNLGRYISIAQKDKHPWWKNHKRQQLITDKWYKFLNDSLRRKL